MNDRIVAAPARVSQNRWNRHSDIWEKGENRENRVIQTEIT